MFSLMGRRACESYWLEQMIGIINGWGRGVGALGKFPRAACICDRNSPQYCYLERQRDAFCFGERKRCCMYILSCYIHFCYSWDNFILNYPSLHTVVQQLHQGRTLHRRQQLLKYNQGTTRKHHNKSPRIGEGAHQLQKASVRIKRATSQVQTGWDPIKPRPAATHCVLQWV